MKLLLAPLAASVLLSAAPAAAVAVPIVNAGFDAQPLSEGGSTFGNVLGGGFGGGWIGIPGQNNSGLYNPEATAMPVIPSETNVAYIGTGVDSGGGYNGAFTQTLAEQVSAGTRYDLSVAIGRRLDGYDLADFVVELFAGSQLVASGSYATADVQAGTFRTLTLGYDAVAGDAGPLGIRFRSIYDPAQGTAYRQTLLDDVRLEATAQAVPEPAAWASMALGFGLVGGAARRRRLSRRAC